MHERPTQYESPVGPQPLPDVETLLMAPPRPRITYNGIPEDDFDLMADMLRRGQLPGIGYFSLVMDHTSADTQYIHNVQFTQYYANWQVPVTPEGHDMFLHDSYHATVAERMFRSQLFAMVTAGAAQISLHTGRTEQFTELMDFFGDAMLDVAEAFHGSIACTEARVFLRELVGVYIDDPDNLDLQDRITNYLAIELGIDERAQRIADIIDDELL